VLSSDPVEVPLSKAYRLLNHGPTVLVTTADDTRRNVMAAAWVMAVDFDPPKIAIVIDSNTMTRKLIDATGRFSLTIPPVSAIDLTDAVGNCSGADVDKFSRFGIETYPTEPGRPPHLRAGIAWLDCEVIVESSIQRTHDLFVARVIAAKADPRAFANGHWVDGAPDKRTIHHIAGGNYFAAGPMIAARKAVVPTPTE
jgi:flavin reductase (DIM6/NTAB) family NADH-FMN oxidoreductase RutF